MADETFKKRQARRITPALDPAPRTKRGQKPLHPNKIQHLKNLKAQGLATRTVARVAQVSLRAAQRYVDTDDVKTRSATIRQFTSQLHTLLPEQLMKVMAVNDKLLNDMDKLHEEGDVSPSASSVLTPGSQELFRMVKSIKDLSITSAVLIDKYRDLTGKANSKSSHEIQVNIVHKDAFLKPIDITPPVHEPVDNEND